MNAIEIMRNGHGTVLEGVDGLAASHWRTPGACGEWSVKDIIAHLASYEWMLVEALAQLSHGDADTPTLDRFGQGPAAFNDAEVAKRRDHNVDETLAEYKKAHEEAMALAERVPAEAWTQDGVLPWYGDAYDLDDFVAYTFYGHKREHSAQIAAFRDRCEE
jgi:hypothetical protein